VSVLPVTALALRQILAVGLARGLALDWLLASSPANGLCPELPAEGLSNSDPLPWWAAGSYAGELRCRLLQLRRSPDPRAMADLTPGLVAALRRDFAGSPRRPLLVPIPSWKRRSNPLPPLLGQLLTRQLGWRISGGLHRSRPVLGQHHLGRELRWANQAGAFRAHAPTAGRSGPRPPLLLVDDILTTGATALAAAAALQAAGWRVAGMACLARTPWQGCDLGSTGRLGDAPG
jgi:predicted amidophosphoribosyltransferase